MLWEMRAFVDCSSHTRTNLQRLSALLGIPWGRGLSQFFSKAGSKYVFPSIVVTKSRNASTVLSDACIGTYSPGKGRFVIW